MISAGIDPRFDDGLARVQHGCDGEVPGPARATTADEPALVAEALLAVARADRAESDMLAPKAAAALVVPADREAVVAAHITSFRAEEAASGRDGAHARVVERGARGPGHSGRQQPDQTELLCLFDHLRA